MDTFLSRVLEHKITVEDLKKWITNPKDATEEIRSHECEPTDFAFFLLSYLRDETTSILISKENKQEEVKDADSTMTRKAPEKKNTKKIIPISKPTNPHPKKAAPITLANFIVTKPTQKHKRNKSQHDNESTRVDSPPAAPKRRINPLKVSVLHSMPSTSNPFNVAEQTSVDLNHERQLLREQSNLDVPNMSKLSILSHDQKTVSNKKQLDTLSKVYSIILDSELALNIMAELYFIIELLTLDDVTISQESDTKIFNSIQNCAYFASKTLHRQQKLIQCLDTTTIRLLSENLYLKEFSPELVCHLQSLKPKTRRTLSVDSNVISYQADTYDRQNFSSQDAFQLFRRQRDAFYSILETWDNDRYFTSSLVTKVQAIFKQKLEPEFYMHFSNLFMSQLIASCIGMNSEKSTNFPDLQVDPMRLKRLQDRLVNPARTSGGPCPSPEFTGWEEFYRDFIKLAANHQFNVHLHNAFITKISELNAQQFAPSDLQDSDTCVEEETVTKFVTCALSLQLLAKFLGWLTFDPYMPSNIRALPEHVIALQAADRHEVHPDLDGCGILSAAENQGRLVLAIPWLCSYVVQLDPASLRLPHYTRLLRHLLALQRALPALLKTSPTARALMRFCLGWALGILAENNPGVWDMARLGLVSHEVPECKPGSLDYLQLVDSQALLSLCPFLAELRTRLSAGGVTTARPCPGPRHITPVTTLDPPQKLELQLEASFLQTQPSHVRRTLDFVSERVSYSCTKHLLSGILAQQAHSLREEVQRVVKTEVPKHQQLRKEFVKFVAAVKEGLAKWTEEKATSHYKEVHSACQTEVQQFCSSHCSAALSHLLVPSPTPLPSQALASIATRNAASKVHSWLQVRFSSGEVQKQTSDEVERCARSENKSTAPKSDPRYSNTLPPGGRPVNHSEQALCPADALVMLRELILWLLRGLKTDQNYVTAVLNNVESCASSRGDLVNSALNFLQELSLDLAFTLVCRQPELLDSALVGKFVSLWSSPALGRPHTLDRLLCVRNLSHLTQAPSWSWSVLQSLLVALIRAKLLSPESLEQQVISVLQQDWPQEFLSNYTLCIRNLVKEVSSILNPSEAATFSQLLEWLADFCRDLDEDIF